MIDIKLQISENRELDSTNALSFTGGLYMRIYLVPVFPKSTFSGGVIRRVFKVPSAEDLCRSRPYNLRSVGLSAFAGRRKIR